MAAINGFCSGDRVAIRSWDDMEAEFGLDENGCIPCYCCFIEDMSFLCGREYTIKDIYDDQLVTFVEEDLEYMISFEMIRHVEDSDDCINEGIDIEDFLHILLDG